MGRHADPFDDSFRRSLLRAVGGGVLAMLITFGVTAALTVVGRDRADEPGQASVSPSEVADDPIVAPPPTTQPLSSGPPTDPPTDPSEPTEEPAPEDPSVVTVQVLDTVGSGEGRDALEAAEVLRDLGYDVVAVFPTRRTTDTTVILATAGHSDEAEALRQADPRFADIGRNDGFKESVDLHVLVAEGFAD